MLRHYLLISVRTILRNKFHSSILTAGLAVGIASAILLGMYTWHEFRFDDFHEKKDRVFLVGVDGKEGVNHYREGWTTPPTGPALQDFFPDVEHFVRLSFWFDDVIVTKGDKKFAETGIVGADSSVFKVFTIPFVAGDPATALKEPNSIVITEQAARKYFGDDDPIGQTLEFDHFFRTGKVTGVVKDYPANSHFDFEILLSLSSLKSIDFDFVDSWGNHTFSTYVLLDEQADASAMERRMHEFVREHLNPYLIRQYQKSYDEVYAGGDYYNLFLVPLADIHLSELSNENQEGKRMLVYALALIGIIIVVLVCINYTNLATALSFGRAREVGIRKAFGSRRPALMNQFLAESMIIAFAGLFLGLGLAELLLPLFNHITNFSLALNYADPIFAVSLIAFTLFVGFVSGLYPALTFASFNPIRALKGKSVVPQTQISRRNSFVVFQFTVCVVMIVSALVVYQQLSFMTHKSLGFEKEQLLVIKRADGLKEKKSAFKNELLKVVGIESASFTQTTPGRHFNGHGQHLLGRPSHEMPVIYPLMADKDILKTLGVKLMTGYTFDDCVSPCNKALINETAVRELGLVNPLEEKIDRGTMGSRTIDITGVVKDFHFKSFHHDVEPLAIFPLDIDNDPNHNAAFVIVRISGGNIAQTLKQIEAEWKKFAGNYPFEFSFLDEDFNRLFQRERTTASVYTIFSGVSVFIACLGLLGLTSFLTSKRSKEVGIRKVVGASTKDVAILLLTQFMRSLLLALVLGSALAWYLMRAWLENFAYRTTINWWTFAIAGVVLLFVALVTISWHVHRAATRNAADVLRHE